MPVTVVVGAQWGDEGKAKVIDLLSKEHTFVVRYQGGHNAGHTVVVDGERYALQLVPSGILYEHVVPVIANGVVVDLPTLFDEIDGLEARGISCSELKVSSRAHLIFPWHQAHDAIAEAMRGDDKIGTTLKGIGPAYADKARRVGIRAGDVLDADRFARLVRERAVGENTLIEQAGGAPLDVDEIVDALRRARDPPRPVRRRHDRHAARRARPRRAHSARRGAGDIPRPRPRHLSLRHLVQPDGRWGLRRFGPRPARHRPRRRDHQGVHHTGRRGPFPTELLDADGDTLVDVGQEFGTVTGRRRRAGWLDCVMLRHAVRLSSITELALTKIDILDGFESVKICTGYRLNGESVDGYPDRSDVLAEIEPVYEVLDGWGSALSDTREPDQLPEQARRFIEIVEREVGVPVRVVGVGAERDDYLVWVS